MITKLKLRGHIIDSLILSKLLDKIAALGVNCYTSDVKVGAKREDLSVATFILECDDQELMEKAVNEAKKHGAVES